MSDSGDELAESKYEEINFYHSIKEINYCIETRYEVNTEPPIHGIITNINIEVIMKDGGIIKLKCDWENSIYITDPDSLTKGEIEIIEEILNEKMGNELDKHLKAFPIQIEGNIKM